MAATSSGTQSTMDIQKQNQNHHAKRDLSSSSDKFNNSLLKLKSRNRCNDNFNLGGPADSHDSCRTKNSNKDIQVVKTGNGMNLTQEPNNIQKSMKQNLNLNNNNAPSNKNSNDNNRGGQIGNKNIKRKLIDDNHGRVQNVVGSVDRKITMKEMPSQLDTSGGNLLGTSSVVSNKLILPGEPLSCQNKANQKLMKNFDHISTLKGM